MKKHKSSIKAKNKGILPDPCGKTVPFAQWKKTLTQISKFTPHLNVYDAERDMGSNVLRIKDESLPTNLIIDPLLPDYSDRLIKDRTRLLLRMHYFEAGLHHRVSVHGRLLKKQMYEGYPALEVELFEPMKVVSNLYLLRSSPTMPMFLEIPVIGAPPEVRVVEFNAKRMVSQTMALKKLTPKTTRMEGMRMQYIDLKDVDPKKDHEFQEEIEEEEPEEPEVVAVSDESLMMDKIIATRNEAEAEAKVLKEKGPKTIGKAVVLLKDPNIRQFWTDMLNSFGLATKAIAFYEDAAIRMFHDADVLVMDVRQGGRHAIDFIRELKERDVVKKVKFVLIGKELENSRILDWKAVGEGKFIRPNAPENWLQKEMEKWMASFLKEKYLEQKSAEGSEKAEPIDSNGIEIGSVTNGQQPPEPGIRFVQPKPDEDEKSGITFVQSKKEQAEEPGIRFVQPREEKVEEPGIRFVQPKPQVTDEAGIKFVQPGIPEEQQQMNARRPAYKEEEPEIPKKVVLISSDDKDSLAILSERLAKHNYEIIELVGTSQTYRTVRIKTPDYIILDLSMPLLYGMGVIRQLKEDIHTKRIPMMLLTAQGGRMQMQEVMKLGIADFIMKPYDLADVLRRIKMYFDKK